MEKEELDFWESEMDSNWEARWLDILFQTLFGFLSGYLIALCFLPKFLILPASIPLALNNGIKTFLFIKRVGKKRRARQMKLEAYREKFEHEHKYLEVEHEREINAPVYEEYQFFFNKPKPQK